VEVSTTVLTDASVFIEPCVFELEGVALLFVELSASLFVVVSAQISTFAFVSFDD